MDWQLKIVSRLAHGVGNPDAAMSPRDRAAGVLRLEPGETKNREGRTFQYRDLVEVRGAIQALWIRQALKAKGIIAPHLFCRGGGQAIKSFYTRWDQACTAAGCPGRIPHDMRRTAVRNLNRAGVPETVAMKITGQKNPLRLRPLRHHQRRGSSRGRAEAPSPDRDNFGDNRPKTGFRGQSRIWP